MLGSHPEIFKDGMSLLPVHINLFSEREESLEGVATLHPRTDVSGD